MQMETAPGGPKLLSDSVDVTGDCVTREIFRSSKGDVLDIVYRPCSSHQLLGEVTPNSDYLWSNGGKVVPRPGRSGRITLAFPKATDAKAPA